MSQPIHDLALRLAGRLGRRRDLGSSVRMHAVRPYHTSGGRITTRRTHRNIHPMLCKDRQGSLTGAVGRRTVISSDHQWVVVGDAPTASGVGCVGAPSTSALVRPNRLPEYPPSAPLYAGDMGTADMDQGSAHRSHPPTYCVPPVAWVRLSQASAMRRARSCSSVTGRLKCALLSASVARAKILSDGWVLFMIGFLPCRAPGCAGVMGIPYIYVIRKSTRNFFGSALSLPNPEPSLAAAEDKSP